MRHGITELLQIISEEKMKIYIVSGGITGVVTESFYILQKQRLLDLSKNLVFCMTPEVYNEDGILVGFGEPTVMTVNKHMNINHTTCKEIEEGSNGIVMGDLIEDYQIVSNLKLANVIGIGFFNPPGVAKPEDLAKFMEIYDIVIAGDGNIIHAAELIRYICGLPLTPEYINFGPSAKYFATILN